jgi:hypothetical protein
MVSETVSLQHLQGSGVSIRHAENLLGQVVALFENARDIELQYK